MSASLYELGVDDLDSAARELIETAPCLVCGHQSARAVFAIEGLDLRVVQCEQCQLGSLWPQPSGDEIRGYYPPEYYGDSGNKFEPLVEAFVRWVALRHARSLARGLPATSDVLDVGCGRGVLLRAFADRGHRVSGFEVSAAAAEGADARAEIRIGSWLGDAGYESESFDLIVLWHVLEHIPDPRGTLNEISRILKPGGKLVVAVPNFSSWQARWAGAAWFHLDLPRHLFHFPAAALRQLLAKCELECCEERHFSLRQNPFGWVQSAFNRWSRLPRNSLYLLLHQRGDSASVSLNFPTRLWLRSCCFLGLPAAVVLSLIAAATHQGATICIEARRTKATPPTSGKKE